MEMDKINKLKQEVEEYLTKEDCCEFKKECEDGVRVRCSEYEAKLYLILRFAEQKEKKIEELGLELTVEKDLHQEQTILHLHAEEYIKSLEKENQDLRDNYDQFKASAIPEIERLGKQIEKMKCCGNCKYGYCGGSSISIDKDGNRTFHNWNEEKQAYCDIGKNGKYQCWELEEND